MELELEKEYSAEFARDKAGQMQKTFAMFDENQARLIEKEFLAARYSTLPDGKKDEIRFTINNLLIGETVDALGLPTLGHFNAAFIPNGRIPDIDLNQKVIEDLFNTKSGASLTTELVLQSYLAEGRAKSPYTFGEYASGLLLPLVGVGLGLSELAVGGSGVITTALTAGGVVTSANQVIEFFKSDAPASPYHEFLFNQIANNKDLREYVLNHRGDYTDLCQLIDNANFDDNTTMQDFYGNLNYDLKNFKSPANLMKRHLASTSKAVALEVKRINAIPNNELKRQEVEKFLNKLLETQHEVTQGVMSIVKQDKKSTRMSKQELSAEVAYYETSSLLVARAFTLGLSYYNFDKAAEYFQALSAPMINLSVISAKYYLNLITPSTFVFAAADIVLGAISWAIGKPQATLIHYFDIIRKQLIQIQQQLSYLCESQVQLLKGLEELTRLIHVNHAALMREVSRVKSELTEFHLSMFSDERQDKLMRFMRQKERLCLLLSQDNTSYDIFRFSAAYHKVYAHAVSVSRLIQFSGDRFHPNDLDDVLERLLRYNRTDLGINYLISFCITNRVTEYAPIFITHSQEVIPNPTEWVRASTVLLNSLLFLRHDQMGSHINVEEHLQVLYKDAEVLSSALSFLANNKNIKNMITDFQKKLPDFLLQSTELVDAELSKQLEKHSLFVGGKSITKKENLPSGNGALRPDIIGRDIYFLRDFVVKRGARYSFSEPSVLIYDSSANSLHSVDQCFEMDVLDPKKFTVLTQKPKLVSKSKLQVKPKHHSDLYDNKCQYVNRQCYEVILTLVSDKNKKNITITGMQYDYELTRHSTENNMNRLHLRIFEFPNWRKEVVESEKYETFFDFLYACEYNRSEFLRQSIMHNLLQKICSNAVFSEKTLELHQTYQQLRAELMSIISAASINQLYSYIGYKDFTMDSLFTLRYPFEDPLKLLIRTAFRLMSQGDEKKTFSQATGLAAKEVSTYFTDIFKSIFFNMNVVNPYTAMPLIAILQQKIVLCAYAHNTRLSFFGGQNARTFMGKFHESESTALERLRNPSVLFADLIEACFKNDLGKVTRLCGLGVLQLPDTEAEIWNLINHAIIHLNPDILDVVLSHLGKRRHLILFALQTSNINADFLTKLTDPQNIIDANAMIIWLESLVTTDYDFTLLFNRLTKTIYNDAAPESLSTYQIILNRLRNRVGDEPLEDEKHILMQFYKSYLLEIQSMVEHLREDANRDSNILDVASLTVRQLIHLVRDHKKVQELFFSSELKSICGGGDEWIKNIMIKDKVGVIYHNYSKIIFTEDEANLAPSEIVEDNQKECLKNLLIQFKYTQFCSVIYSSVEIAACRRNIDDAINACANDLSFYFGFIQSTINLTQIHLSAFCDRYTRQLQSPRDYHPMNLQILFYDQVLVKIFDNISYLNSVVSSLISPGSRNLCPDFFIKQLKVMGIDLSVLKNAASEFCTLADTTLTNVMKRVVVSTVTKYSKKVKAKYAYKEDVYGNVEDVNATDMKYLQHIQKILEKIQIIAQQLESMKLLDKFDLLFSGMPWKKIYEIEYAPTRIKFFQTNNTILDKLAPPGGTMPSVQRQNSTPTSPQQQRTVTDDDFSIPTAHTFLGRMF